MIFGLNDLIFRWQLRRELERGATALGSITSKNSLLRYSHYFSFGQDRAA
jgi:hypothetical protein